ncbi:MAG: MBL fold metallo-hydrolase, partial [Bacteroidota bacterium]
MIYRSLSIIGLVCLFANCSEFGSSSAKAVNTIHPILDNPALIVLGTVQDAGSPHIGCNRDCCKDLFGQADRSRQVVSLGLLDGEGKQYLFEATPDMSSQIFQLNQYVSNKEQSMPDGIFLTHAHIGHYSGLMYLGKEAINADQIPVYAMPRMMSFLKNNGPWSQLVTNQNISIVELENRRTDT